MKSFTIALAAASIGVAALAAAALAAQQAGTVTSPVERGEAHYLLFCANCHGVRGDGQGPLVKALRIVPPDLTHLAPPGEGVAERVLKAVDGRHEVPGPDGPRMPLFSDNLEVRTIVEIGEYLKTIQQPAAP